VLTTPHGILGLTLLAFVLAFVALVLDQANYKSPFLVYVFAILAGISALGTLAAFLGPRAEIVKRWWPFALARTVYQLRTRLREAERDNQRLRDRNEQVHQLNTNLGKERDQLSDVLQDTRRDKAKLKQELMAAKTERGDTPQIVAQELWQGAFTWKQEFEAHSFNEFIEAPTFEVEADENMYLVTLTYETRGGYIAQPTIQIATRIEIVNRAGSVIKSMTVYTGAGEVQRGADRWYTVHATATLTGLPKGVYTLRTYEASKVYGTCEYRDVRQVVAKVGRLALRGD
jgi:hypothetical protein